MKTKTTRTHSISDEVYEEFMKIIEEKNMNKSKLIEKWIIEFIEKNKMKK